MTQARNTGRGAQLSIVPWSLPVAQLLVPGMESLHRNHVQRCYPRGRSSSLHQQNTQRLQASGGLEPSTSR